MNGFTAMLKDEQGAALTEYALIMALLAVAMITALTTLGSSISTAFNNFATDLTNAQKA